MFNFTEQDLENIIKYSYKNFHVKGFNYLCLNRSKELTEKVYFFDGDLSQLPELVVPHNHRYNFKTKVISGVVTNKLFIETNKFNPHHIIMNRFEYETPLNGGCGFYFNKEVALVECHRKDYFKGDDYFLQHSQLHTLQIQEPETIILLEQYADVIAINKPTLAYFKPDIEPDNNLSGLYEKFTIDEILILLERFNNVSKKLSRT